MKRIKNYLTVLSLITLLIASENPVDAITEKNNNTICTSNTEILIDDIDNIQDETAEAFESGQNLSITNTERQIEWTEEIGQTIYEFLELDQGDMDFNEILDKTYGIVFEVNDDTDINTLNLKYDFFETDSIYISDCGKITVSHRPKNKNVYVYEAAENISYSDLLIYAKELSEIDNVKYAEAFNVKGYIPGSIIDTSKNDCRIYFRNNECQLNVDKINSDVNVLAYLESIGAEKQVFTVNENDIHSMSPANKGDIYITGIKDRRQYFDIVNKLNTFESMKSAKHIFATSKSTYPIVEYDFEGRDYTGDANADKYIDVRDCAEISSMLALHKGDTLPKTADYNKDGNKDVRDAAFMARDLAAGNI